MSNTQSPDPAPGVERIAVWTFTATTLAASALLFLVQPMFAKMALPRLGGSPSVWNTCMLFFQTMLLLGYVYAHLSTRLLGARRQAMLHVGVMASALALLPLGLGDSTPSADQSPVWWLLRTLTVRLGLPFFALSTMAPLTQRWFATLPVPSASSPYFLYAASNAGSMCALIAYPFLLEPRWGTRTLALAWSAGYGVLVVLVALCAWRLHRDGRERPGARRGGGVSWALALRWTTFAFVPSSLMLGVTTHVTTDVASIPLLWVLPLALYLLTFVLVFSDQRRYPRQLVIRILPLLVLASILSIAFQAQSPWLILLHLLTFFVAALVCHDRLVASRPAADDLTAFYVWMSVGGMLGGAFNTLLAPVIFTGIYEYPLVLALACLARPSPGYRGGRLEPLGLFIAIGVLPVVLLLALWAAGRTPTGVSFGAVLLISALVPAALSAVANRRAPFNLLVALAVAGLMVASATRSVRGDVVFAGRSFFGVSRVLEAVDHSYRLLQSGTTLHGRENLPAGARCDPQAYYDPAGPIGDVFLRSGRRFSDVALVGLGSGGLTCYAAAGSRWTVFEIDPVMQRIAEDRSLFTFLSTTRGQMTIAIGDGRKGIEDAAPGSYDLIVLDAFSSDAVPVHLLTSEAIDTYLARLRPGGIVALHISNRHVDLEPVLADLTSAGHPAALTRSNLEISADDARRGRAPTQWVVLSADAAPLTELRALPGWRALAGRERVRAWTDDYSNLLRSLRWR